MHTVTAFAGSAVSQADLTSIMTEHLALERAQIMRRLLVTRFGGLGAIIVATGLAGHGVPPSVYWGGAALCAAVPMCAWIAELRHDCRLARRLEQVPGGVTHVLP